jgi:UDPglucose 6-dehydrogenase
MKNIEITCIGAGYVGGPTMAVIALKCPDIKVNVVDINQERIDQWNGSLDKLPVFEPGLKDVIKETRNKNLFFSTDIEKAINTSEIIFIAVNTPTKTEGEGKGMAADLKYVVATAETIAKFSKQNKIIVEKSTLPVRTAEMLKKVLRKNNNKVDFEIVSNPEFLAEGTAINDLFKSDRVLIGADETESGKKAMNKIIDIYSNWIPREKIITSNVWSAELSKLSSNAMLAQRISSINSLSALCEKTEARIEEVSNAVGKDHRIGSHFLKSSVGFGGSCFKKDILNLVYICRSYNLDEVADYWSQVIKINDYQKERFSNLIIDYLNKHNVTKASILGWAFKKDTNDSRESAAIDITYNLISSGISVDIYDPMVSNNRILQDINNILLSKGAKNIDDLMRKVNIFSSINNCVNGHSAIAIITEWDEFKEYSWDEFCKKNTKEFKIFDGRGIIEMNNTDNLFKIGNPE